MKFGSLRERQDGQRLLESLKRFVQPGHRLSEEHPHVDMFLFASLRKKNAKNGSHEANLIHRRIVARVEEDADVDEARLGDEGVDVVRVILDEVVVVLLARGIRTEDIDEARRLPINNTSKSLHHLLRRRSRRRHWFQKHLLEALDWLLTARTLTKTTSKIRAVPHPMTRKPTRHQRHPR